MIETPVLDFILKQSFVAIYGGLIVSLVGFVTLMVSPFVTLLYYSLTGRA